MKIIHIGKTEVRVSTHGCYDCGSELDSDAYEAGEAELVIDGIQRMPIQLWRCARCYEKYERGFELPYSRELDALFTPRCPDHNAMMPCTLKHR